MAILRYETPDGEILIETDGAETALSGVRSKGAGGVVDAVLDGGSFEKAIDRIKVVGNAVAKTMHEIATPPETAEVELALKFTGAAGVVFARAGAEAQMRVKLVWKPKLVAMV